MHIKYAYVCSEESVFACTQSFLSTFLLSFGLRWFVVVRSRVFVLLLITWVDPFSRCVFCDKSERYGSAPAFFALFIKFLAALIACSAFLLLWGYLGKDVVLKLPFMTKCFEFFFCRKLRSIVWDAHIQNTIAHEIDFKVVYDSMWCSVWQCINFPESRVVIHCDGIIEVIAAEEVCPNFHPQSTWHLMRMQHFLGLLAVKRMADAAIIYIILAIQRQPWIPIWSEWIRSSISRLRVEGIVGTQCPLQESGNKINSIYAGL